MAHASLLAKQQQLVARLCIIEDSHERLSAITTRARRWPEPRADERTAETRVAGCVSPVWLTASRDGGRCHFRVAAESSLVHGLAALLCELYDGEPADEIAAFEPTIFSELGLDRQLSPTRLNGLANIRRVIRDFAAAERGA